VVLGTTDHVPVGGGVILADRQIVLTQPTAGVIKAFTAVCTHQGCTVSSIEGDLIVCPCHGSRYHLNDGSVANGPAPRPLAPIAVTVSGTDIVQS
jgi:Rieske Fe-S protein